MPTWTGLSFAKPRDVAPTDSSHPTLVGEAVCERADDFTLSVLVGENGVGMERFTGWCASE